MKIQLPTLRKPAAAPAPGKPLQPPPGAAPPAGPAAPITGGQPAVGPSGLGDRMRLISRKLRGATGWIFLFLAVFIAFAWLSLPTRGIAWRIGQEARKAGFLIDIEDVSVWPWGSATLHKVKWTYAPSHPGQVPHQLELESVRVKFSVLKYLIFRDIDVSVDTEIDAAPIHAEYARSESESTIKVEVSELPLMDVPKLQQALGVPLRGTFAFAVDLTVPQNLFAKAEGSISIECAACSLGDNESLLFIPGSSGITAKGMTIPEIDLGTLKGELKVKDGKAVAEEFGTKSADVEVLIWGDISMKDPFSKSEFGISLKLLVTKALQEKSETLRFAVQTAGPSSKMDGADEGWLGFKIRGTVGRPRFMGIKAKTAEERMLEKRQKNAEREAKRSRERAKKDTAKSAREEAETKVGDTKVEIKPIDLAGSGVPESDAGRAVDAAPSSATPPPSSIPPPPPVEEAKPEEAKPEEARPEEARPEEAKPEEAKPEEARPEEARPAEGGEGQGQGQEGGEAPAAPPEEAPAG